jgi:erythromycin esterase-like protein
MEIKHVRPSLQGSFEQLCHDSGKCSFLLDFKRDDAVSHALRTPRQQRFIGVIYRPETERLSHYMNAATSSQFDAFVWFDQTSSVMSLARHERGSDKVPDTFPFGN